MSRPIPARPEDAPGHYGAGYGEQVPEDAPPRPAPATDSETDDGAADRTAGGTTTSPGGDPAPGAASSARDRDSAPVDFTAADVTPRPPGQMPTEHAPDRDQAGLLFERS